MIRVLDKTVADKIAAGEVVDRPVSIIKELVENSLDAEAGSITVELRGGGKQYLRVSDDGCGIDGDDTETAFLRHATSKIETEEDLSAIRSLGFRGEALASICAVSRVDMITKTGEAHAGRHLTAEAGRVISNMPTGCPDGTTITVRDLFYNLPARKKFLGSDGAEARRIIDLMSRIALAYPDVRFRLISNGKEVFQTTGRGSIHDNICRIYGRDLGRDLVQVDERSGDMILRGFVGSPDNSSSSRNRQFFCVNGRVVASKTIERGLEKAYRERMFAGRFPIAFLFLYLPADQLDVNVHPTKREIRFDDDFAVEDFVTEGVIRVLSLKQAIPAAKAGSPVTGPAQIPPQTPSEKKEEERKPAPVREEEQGEQVDIKNLLQSMRRQEEEKGETVREPSVSDAYSPDSVTSEEGGAGPAEKGTADPLRERLDIGSLEVLGSVLQTYIVASDANCLYLIDQHAAHERVFYEKLLDQYHSSEKFRQEMLIPLRLTASADLEAAEDSWIGYLRDMGYDIENFGSRTYIVRAMPAFAEPVQAEQFLRQMLIELSHGPDLHSFAGLDRLITRSCKSAVKGGDRLHPEEIRSLLTQLSACRNPWSCPHGRPTIIRMNRQDLERLFKR